MLPDCEHPTQIPHHRSSLSPTTSTHPCPLTHDQLSSPQPTHPSLPSSPCVYRYHPAPLSFCLSRQQEPRPLPTVHLQHNSALLSCRGSPAKRFPSSVVRFLCNNDQRPASLSPLRVPTAASIHPLPFLFYGLPSASPHCRPLHVNLRVLRNNNRTHQSAL